MRRGVLVIGAALVGACAFEKKPNKGGDLPASDTTSPPVVRVP